jgi:hypothetical protein
MSERTVYAKQSCTCRGYIIATADDPIAALELAQRAALNLRVVADP